MTLLHPPDSYWHDLAQRESDALIRHIDGLATVHHIDSTSVPALTTKPVLDLLPVFHDAKAQTAAETRFESLHYEWLGEFGLP